MIERENPGELPYTTFVNELLNDADLGAEALGMLVYLLSKPANWKVMPSELAKRFGCGKDKIYRIINDLVTAGYARRTQGRSGDGSFSEGHLIISSNKNPVLENPETAGLPHLGEPDRENPTLQKKESTKEIEEQSSEFFELEPTPDSRKPISTDRPSKNGRRGRIPDDFTLDDKMREYAAKKGIRNGRVAEVFEQFRNHHSARGTVMADWPAAWRTWVGNEIRFHPPQQKSDPRSGYGDDWM